PLPHEAQLRDERCRRHAHLGRDGVGLLRLDAPGIRVGRAIGDPDALLRLEVRRGDLRGRRERADAGDEKTQTVTWTHTFRRATISTLHTLLREAEGLR